MLEIRWATEGDEPVLAELLVSCGLEPMSVAGGDVVIAFEGKTLVASGGLEHLEDHGWVRSIAVAVDRRGNGLARRMLERVVERARERQLRRLWLMTETAEGFFAAQGFAPCARVEAPEVIRGFAQWTGCPGTAVLMSKML